MKLNRVIGTFVLFSLFFTYSCAADRAARKKQMEASMALGEAYMGQKDFTLALKEFLKAETLYPDDPFLQNDLGLAYLAKKEPGIAITHFKKAVKLNKEYAPAKNNLGIAYLSQKEWDLAIECFNELKNDLLYAKPQNPLTNMGFAYFGKGDYKKAEENYKEALKIEPEFVIAMRGLGKTYLAQGRYEQSVQIFERALEKAPRFAALYLDMGKAYSKMNRKKKAVHAFKMVMELTPDTDLEDEARTELAKILNNG